MLSRFEFIGSYSLLAAATQPPYLAEKHVYRIVPGVGAEIRASQKGFWCQNSYYIVVGWSHMRPGAFLANLKGKCANT